MPVAVGVPLPGKTQVPRYQPSPSRTATAFLPLRIIEVTSLGLVLDVMVIAGPSGSEHFIPTRRPFRCISYRPALVT